MTLFKLPFKTLCAGCLLVLLHGRLAAQQRSLSIREAVSLAAAQQPQLKAQREQANAAAYGTDLARNTLMPELTAGYQAGYATYNNITGMTYPGMYLPISGPPSAGNTYDAVPGTVLSALLTWSPLTFGQREAAVEKAAAQYKLAGSQYNDALFRQQYAVISAYLDAVYLFKLMQSSKGNIERSKTGLEQSLVLAKEGLRPGIDTAQFQSALAQAEIDLLTLQRKYFEQLTELARLTGVPDQPKAWLLADTFLVHDLPALPDTSVAAAMHPLYQVYQDKLDVSEAALKAVQREWRPKLDIWANAYARGSGVAADGTVNKADGWSLSRNNYGAGIQLSFPVLGFSRTGLRKKQYQSLLRSDEAQLEQVKLDLQQQRNNAAFNFDQQLGIAQHSLVQTRTAQFAYTGLRLSYENGLTDFTRLMQGQYELLKAESFQAGAFVQAWRALLDISVANGNLDVFIDNLKQ
ncbi:TolC family protein [Chitinophaga sp. XS-30]|uniref:TolC family protein n=1 Tax=Chitinophaga sp. XS-30 TaxID=2604421 RepID=UPI0011DDB124|nr:TolC family protein [Chitinophaga sp. XS-30]QEH42505.1 TolC family protein [Chitinophaga sp. XS-30]